MTAIGEIGELGVRSGMEQSGTEWNRVEQSGIRIIRIKIKEKCDIITLSPCSTKVSNGRFDSI